MREIRENETELDRSPALETTTREVWEKMLVPSRRTKVDRVGKFLPFANITVVCHLLELTPQLKELPAKLTEIAGRYLSPLPFDSYHTTVVVGPCAYCHSRREWEGVLYNDCWKKLSAYLEERCYSPKDLHILDPNQVKASSSGVTLYFPNVLDGRIRPPYQGDEEATVVREEIRNLGSRVYGFEGESEGEDDLFEREDTTESPAYANILEEESLMSSRTSAWHVTLAYPREEGGEMPTSVQKEVQKAVIEAFDSPSILSTQKARLCLSPDMTEFIAWDGKAPPEEEEEEVVVEELCGTLGALGLGRL